MKVNERKHEITKIAYKLFLTKGYDNTSVDEIIKEAGIAKGTYYYYFESKEQTLEAVIHMMLDQMIIKAKQVIDMPLSATQKMIHIIMCFRPDIKEQQLSDAIHLPENIVMHQKINKKIIEAAVPILSKVVEQGNEEKILNCQNHISEKVKITLLLSQNLFDERTYSETDIAVYIELLEHLYGTEKGTLEFVRDLIKNKGIQ